jgi:uncharacterized protein YcgL (UPF0745 family)
VSRLVKIYRSPRQRDMYLYVDFGEDLERVPDALLKRFGQPIQAMSLELAVERKLARADAGVVLQSIEEAGYYLQMPPRPSEPPA